MRVYSGRRSRPSSQLLRERLSQLHYTGLDICWGYPAPAVGAVNGSVGRYNKRTALLKMAAEGVPTPNVYSGSQALEAVRDYVLVGRPDSHRAGQHFYLCVTGYEVRRAIERGCTHFLDYIEGGREFRVHVAFGKSIKLAEKIGGSGYVKNRQHGWYFAYPQDFDHKKSLREVARKAVESLSLDFGAVDMIYQDGQYYVLEVNTAPCLTSRSDTLERYLKAFVEESQC